MPAVVLPVRMRLPEVTTLVTGTRMRTTALTVCADRVLLEHICLGVAEHHLGHALHAPMHLLAAITLVPEAQMLTTAPVLRVVLAL